jgi:hypothetical protein
MRIHITLLVASASVALAPGSGAAAQRQAIVEQGASTGFIRVGPSHRYFQYEGGPAFFVIGHNATGALAMPGKKGFGWADVEWYFENAHDHGENVLRFICDWSALPIEKPAGTFNPEFKDYLDRMVKLAEKHDLYLMLSMWSNVLPTPAGWLLSWQDHCYAARNGGPVAKYENFFRDDAALKLQEGRIRFFIDNWGKSDHVFAWELANEFNYDNDPWVARMAKYCRQYELAKYGKRHLVCISVGAPSARPAGAQQWVCPDLDFAVYHTYEGHELLKLFPDRGPERYLKYTFLTAEFNDQVRVKAPDRPRMDGEVPGLVHGPAKLLLNSAASDDVVEESFLTTSLAYMCSGAAGAGLRWQSLPVYGVRGKPNALGEKLYDYQLAVRRFADRVDWNRIDPVPYPHAKVHTADKRDVRCIVTVAKDGRRVVGFVLDGLGATQPITVTAELGKLRSEPHVLRWVETRTGNLLKTDRFQGATAVATSPPFLGHVGFYLAPKSE